MFIALRQLHQALIVCNVPDLWMHKSTSMRMSHARGPRQTDDASTLDTHNPNGRGRRGCVTTESPNPPPVEAVCTPLAHNHIDWRREPVLNPAQCALRVGGGWGAQGSRERTQGLEQTLSEELFQLGDLGPTVLSRCLGSIVPDRLVPSPSAPTGPPLHRAACKRRLFWFPGLRAGSWLRGLPLDKGQGDGVDDGRQAHVRQRGGSRSGLALAHDFDRRGQSHLASAHRASPGCRCAPGAQPWPRPR